MIDLHIGVHKTGTTYLQDLLNENRGKMAAVGRGYWSRVQMRPLLTELQSPNWWTKARADAVMNHPSSPLVRMRQIIAAAPHTVISEENIIGDLRYLSRGQYYPLALQHLRPVQTALANEKVVIWLGLRSYDEYLASAYCETLRHGSFQPIATFVDRNKELPRKRWPHLVDAINVVFPASRIIAWAYEDFRSLLPQIAERLTGVDYAELNYLPRDLRVSPSHEAVEKHSAVAEQLRPYERVLSMARCDEIYPRQKFPAKFDPWSSGEAARMRAIYRSDLEDIASRPYVEFLTPP